MSIVLAAEIIRDISNGITKDMFRKTKEAQQEQKTTWTDFYNLFVVIEKYEHVRVWRDIDPEKIILYLDKFKLKIQCQTTPLRGDVPPIVLFYAE